MVLLLSVFDDPSIVLYLNMCPAEANINFRFKSSSFTLQSLSRQEYQSEKKHTNLTVYCGNKQLQTPARACQNQTNIKTQQNAKTTH